jgi:hypothetical protein
MRIDYTTLKEIADTITEEYSVNIRTQGKYTYLRFGYWQRMDMNKLKSILGNQVKVEEESFYDDDCGDLFYYTIKDIHGF